MTKTSKKTNEIPNFIERYFAEIQNRNITVGKYIFKLYELITSRISAGELIFAPKKAQNAIGFIENYCRHSKGRNDKIKLELWQKALISLIFGVVNSENKRVFREVFIVVGRKNGKSLLASAIMAYFAFSAREYGSEIYCVATKKSQAEIVFESFESIVKSDEELFEKAKICKSKIYIEDSNTVVKPLPSTPKQFDGLVPELIVCDELAAWVGESGIKQYEVLKSAFGSRKQPLMLSITTAGYESDGIYDELFKRSTAFLNGDTRENALLPVLYTIDDELLFNDLTELKKSNPNMGVSVFPDYFKNEIAIAENSERHKSEFLTKYCNLKQNSSFAWLPFSVINEAGCDLTLEDFRGCYAVGGIDLSMIVDLTASSLVVEKNDILYLFAQLYMPEEKYKKDHANRVINDAFIKQGILKISGKNFIDYNDVVEWFTTIRGNYNIYALYIGYDHHSAKETVLKLENEGFNLEGVIQRSNLHSDIMELEGKIKDGRVKICNNELLKRHFCNVALKPNQFDNGHYMIQKLNPSVKIDGVASVLDAMVLRRKYLAEIGYLLKN